METTNRSDSEQAAVWNGHAGHAWVEAQPVLDRMFQAFEDLLADAVVARSARRVLDVGCGTGSTSLAMARRLGAERRVVGVDISGPMIVAARARAGREGVPAQFVHADAQTYGFEPGDFDAIVSRFGVMFFEDAVSAFRNLRRAAADGAELRFVAWRSADENPFMTTAERAAGATLDIPARQADAPGQFAFADPDRVRQVLVESGWADVDIQPLDVACTFPEQELVGYVTRFGPVGRLLHAADEATRAKVAEVVRPAFDPYVHGAEVRFTAACWLVVAGT